MELNLCLISMFLMNKKTRIRQRAKLLAAVMFRALGEKGAPFVFLKDERWELTRYLGRYIAAFEHGKLP